MNPVTTTHRPSPAVEALPANATAAFDPQAAIDREFAGIAAEYTPGTVYGASREATLTDAERALIRPVGVAVGALAVGVYSVGEQSDTAKWYTAQHEDWLKSGDRTAAQAEVLAMQAAVDAGIRKNANLSINGNLTGEDDNDDEENARNKNKSSKVKRSSLDLAS